MRENRDSIQARRAYAELLRHFIAGRLTNDEYEDRLDELFKMHGRDRACEDIFAAVWHLYDDLSVHRMDGRHAIGKALRRRIAGWIVFLRSELPYTPPTLDPSKLPKRFSHSPSWPVRIVACVAGVTAFAGPGALLYGVVSAGVWIGIGTFALICIGVLVLIAEIDGRGLSLDDAVYQAAFGSGEQSSWPFDSLEQRAQVAANPTMLSGRSREVVS